MAGPPLRLLARPESPTSDRRVARRPLSARPSWGMETRAVVTGLSVVECGAAQGRRAIYSPEGQTRVRAAGPRRPDTAGPLAPKARHVRAAGPEGQTHGKSCHGEGGGPRG